MTKKEQREMARLRVENKQLRDAIETHLKVYRENLYELVELKTKIEMIEFALGWEDD